MRLAAVLVVLLLAGCASGGEPAGSPSPSASTSPVPAELLPGADWVLMSSPYGVTLRFDEGKVSGKAPVNRYFGSASMSDATLVFGPLATTQMAGTPEAMQAETDYLKVLPEVTQWQVADEVLTLSGAGGPLLKYAAPDSTGAFAVTLIGQPRGEAKAAAAAAGYEFRVLSVDGESKVGTSDYRTDRINASIEDGVVTEVSVG